MANQTININRKRYAVGLMWQPIGAGFNARNYARNLSNTINRRLNLYIEYRAMVGLGARRDGLHTGMYSAAAEVMESFSEYTSFLAVFQVPNGFYLVASRNGIILQDILFDNADAARREYVKLSEIPDWGAFFAPSTWGMPRAIERNISELLSNRSHVFLRPISHFKSAATSLLLVGAFILLFVAVFRDSIVQSGNTGAQVAELNPELVAEYKRQIEEKNKELDAQFKIEKQLPPPPLVMPYENLPNPIARAELCYQAMAFLMQPVAGWNQTYVSCEEEYVIAEFVRTFGTLVEFYEIATDLMPGAYVEEINEDTLRVRAALPILDTFSSQDERDPDSVVRDITSIFQGFDMNLNTQIVVDTISNGVDTVNLNVVEVGADTKLIPMQFMDVFEDFGGVYLMRASWDMMSRTWNYEVIIYAK
ncbi:MAG: type 4b pilus protein PilO2 [Alphaproteobacteria bacterium]|nr:type 4b pilus protein PilO2 [Alphaproteobacteria bacterium]